jgi:hypothetical protein
MHRAKLGSGNLEDSRHDVGDCTRKNPIGFEIERKQEGAERNGTYGKLRAGNFQQSTLDL